MPNSSSPHRLGHIDAMRAIAVLLVIWTHYAEVLSRIAGSQLILDALPRSVDFGRVGVVLFFCISGMLIPTSLRGAPRDGTRRFLIRRFLRLYPAFWLSLPLGYLVYWVLFGNRMEAAGLVANVTMIPTAFGFDPVMGHYWTLETELYFYALCLVLYWFGALQKMRALCAACAGLCVLFVVTSALHLIPADALGQYKGMLFHLAIMFWGACFRQAYDAPHETLSMRVAGRNRQISYRAAVVALAALISALALLMAAINWRHHDALHVSASLGYVVGLALFITLSTVLKLRARFLAWLGEISYSIYLLHAIPAYLLFWACQRYPFTGGPLALYMVAALIPALVLSWLSYRFCEAPAVRLAHALTPSRSGRARTDGTDAPPQPAHTAPPSQ
ncbi:acyltransferase family protein [Burkholderia alba]|uniref:acyltransferase family protein n=1 Tax=Burkholderia alba TaxID=2683677 RepID=UPI002B05DD66|nr:acyltransferase [Burkholderia alba]